MTKDLQSNIKKDKKSIFKEGDYVSFMLGVFVLGGLLVIPLLWWFAAGFRHIDTGNYYNYFPYILPFSLMLCVGVLIAFRRNGTTSWIRVIFTIVIGIIVSSVIAAASGKLAFVSGTILSFLILILCGRIGIWASRLIHRYNNK